MILNLLGIGLIIDYGHEGDKTDTFRVTNSLIILNQFNMMIFLENKSLRKRKKKKKSN